MNVRFCIVAMPNKSVYAYVGLDFVIVNSGGRKSNIQKTCGVSILS